MRRWAPRQFRLRTLFYTVMVCALLMAYAGRYVQLRERSRIELKDYGLLGFLYAPAEQVFRTEDLTLHRQRAILFAPANWVDRTFFEGEAPVGSIMFSLD